MHSWRPTTAAGFSQKARPARHAPVTHSHLSRFTCHPCASCRTGGPRSHSRSRAHLSALLVYFVPLLPRPAQVLVIAMTLGWALICLWVCEAGHAVLLLPCAALALLATMRRRWAAQAAQRSHPAPHAVHSPASHLSDSSAAASRTPEAQLAAGPASVSLDSSFQVVEDLASQRSLASEVVDLTKDSDLHWYFRKAPVPDSPKPLPSDQHSPASKASPPGHRLKLSPHGDLPTVADLARPPTQQHTSTLRKGFFPSHASDSPLSPPPPPKRSAPHDPVACKLLKSPCPRPAAQQPRFKDPHFPQCPRLRCYRLNPSG